MYHDTTGEIFHPDRAEKTTICQKPATPDPVHHRCIDYQHPKGREQQYKTKAHSFHICPGDQSRGDHRKGHLECEKQHFGQCAGQAVGCDTDQEYFIQTTPKPAFPTTKSDGIAKGESKHAHQAGYGINMHENAKHITRPH